MNSKRVLHILSVLAFLTLVACGKEEEVSLLQQQSEKYDLTINVTNGCDMGGYLDAGDDTPMLRYSFEIYGSASISQPLYTEQSQTPECSLSSLEEDLYTILVWCDYATATLEDLFYDTSSLRSVAVDTSAYPSTLDYREAAYGSTTIEISGAAATASVALSTPFAEISLISTDVERYILDAEGGDYPDFDDLRAEATYTSYAPTTFNVASGRAIDAAAGHKIVRWLSVDDALSDEVVVASDYLFANGSSSVTLSISVYDDRDNSELSSVSGVVVDYTLGEDSSVRGEYLTSGESPSGGITIDDSWSGEYEVVF